MPASFFEPPPEEWSPWLQAVRSNIFEVVSPPAAMGSGHRGIAHKCGLVAYSWALGARTNDIRPTALTYVSHTSDMGVELSIADFNCSDPKVLLPTWMALDSSRKQALGMFLHTHPHAGTFWCLNIKVVDWGGGVAVVGAKEICKPGPRAPGPAPGERHPARLGPAAAHCRNVSCRGCFRERFQSRRCQPLWVTMSTTWHPHPRIV